MRSGTYEFINNGRSHQKKLAVTHYNEQFIKFYLQIYKNNKETKANMTNYVLQQHAMKAKMETMHLLNEAWKSEISSLRTNYYECNKHGY